MTQHEWRSLTNIDHDCFGCGQHNHQGLKMTFASNGEQLRSELVIPEHLRGWSNLVHGGITTTILDEMMGWAHCCPTVSGSYNEPHLRLAFVWVGG